MPVARGIAIGILLLIEIELVLLGFGHRHDLLMLAESGLAPDAGIGGIGRVILCPAQSGAV